MGRCAAGVVTALLALPLLQSCTPQADEHASTTTDVRRAESAWTDPWLAPVDLAVPTTAYGSNGYVSRSAGSREQTLDGDPRTAARLEVRAALVRHWQLLGATCGRRTVTAQLTKGGSLDEAVLAVVSAEASRGRHTDVTVTGLVPHHADGSWPPLDGTPVALDDTCLAGGTRGALVTLPAGPTPGTGRPPLDDFEGWQRDAYAEGEKHLLDDVAADPWVAATVPDAADTLAPRDDLRTGDNDRFGVFASGELGATDTDPRAATAAVVDDMDGWDPTWASCSPGRTGAVDVRLRLVVDDGVATVRLVAGPGVDGVGWSLRTPVAEGPSTDWIADAPALTGSRCLGTGALPRGLTIEGTPVSLPYHLQPTP